MAFAPRIPSRIGNLAEPAPQYTYMRREEAVRIITALMNRLEVRDITFDGQELNRLGLDDLESFVEQDPYRVTFRLVARK